MVRIKTRWEVSRQRSPFDAVIEHVEDSVEDQQVFPLLAWVCLKLAEVRFE